MPLTQRGFQNENVTKARAKLQRDPFSDAVEINNVAKKVIHSRAGGIPSYVLPSRFLRFQFS
jgi:hypothetical protein